MTFDQGSTDFGEVRRADAVEAAEISKDFEKFRHISKDFEGLRRLGQLRLKRFRITSKDFEGLRRLGA